MSDFSMFSLFTAGLALFVPLSAAYTQPKGDAPKGNPISQPGLASIVPAGKPFTVTWEPTTDGTVTLVLLKGPSTNAEPQYAIAEMIPNDGSFDWTPKKDLEPTETAEGYGIQLIVDSNGQYQYTTQFGISNPNYKADEAEETTSASSAKPTVTPAAGYEGHSNHGYGNHGHGGSGHGAHNVHSGYSHSLAPSGSASGIATLSTYKSNSTSSSSAKHTAGPYGSHNITMTSATGGATTHKPAVTSANSAPTYGSGSAPSNSTPEAPQATGNAAAGSVVASFGGIVLAAGALVFAL